MSKRARQMALMGFVTGALSDVMKRREQTRLEEAEARKEARLAAIRSEERIQDDALATERIKLTDTLTSTREAANDTRQQDQTRLQYRLMGDNQSASDARQAAEGNKNRAVQWAQVENGRRQGRAPNIETFVDDSGKAYNFNLNDPAALEKFNALSEKTSLRPYRVTADRYDNPSPSVQPAAPSKTKDSGLQALAEARAAVATGRITREEAAGRLRSAGYAQIAGRL